MAHRSHSTVSEAGRQLNAGAFAEIEGGELHQFCIIHYFCLVSFFCQADSKIREAANEDRLFSEKQKIAQASNFDERANVIHRAEMEGVFIHSSNGLKSRVKSRCPNSGP